MKKIAELKELLKVLLGKYGLPATDDRIVFFEFKIRLFVPSGLPVGFKKDLDKLLSGNGLYRSISDSDSEVITILEKGWPVW